MNVRNFLDDIHGDNHINFRAIKKKAIKLNGLYNDDIVKQLEKLNQQGYNIYYVVNGGGDTDESIKKINAVYIDFDCGRDENKEYYALDIVKKYKETKKKVIESFRFEPSFLVETRNGYHAYWLVNDGASVEQFNECQNRLIDYFDSDKAVKNPSRVMRLPDYNWVKDINNPFMCRVVKSTSNRYDIENIINHLPSVNIEKESYKKPKLNSQIYKRNHNYNNIIKRYGSAFKIEPLSLSASDYYEYILTYDLREILQVDSSLFNCILPNHEDNSPSAGFVMNKENGHMIYHCFGCGASYNNIQLMEKILNNKSRYKTLKWFESVLNIKKADTKIIREYKERIDMMIEFIISGEFAESNPTTYKIVKRDIEKLVMLLEFAKMNLFSEKYVTENGNPIFFGSRRKIGSDVFGIKRPDTVNKTIQLFNLLGLINKLAPDQLPEEVFKIAKEHSIDDRITNHFEIPDLYTDYLIEMEDKAKVLKDNNYSKKGLSREYIFRTFGEEIANKYFPQHTHKKRHTKQSDVNTQKIVSFIMDIIDVNGYVKFNDIIENAYQLGMSKSKAEKQFKISVQEICDSYDLKVIKATKENKEKYELPESLHGATKLIVKCK